MPEQLQNFNLYNFPEPYLYRDVFMTWIWPQSLRLNGIWSAAWYALEFVGWSKGWAYALVGSFSRISLLLISQWTRCENQNDFWSKMNISVKNDFSIKNSLSLNYKNYNWKDFSFLDSRTVSNPFHDGTFCEHPRPLTSDSSTFYQGAVILEWIFIVTDDVSRTTSVHVTNLGYKSNCMTHLCDSYHPDESDRIAGIIKI